MKIWRKRNHKYKNKKNNKTLSEATNVKAWRYNLLNYLDIKVVGTYTTWKLWNKRNNKNSILIGSKQRGRANECIHLFF